MKTDICGFCKALDLLPCALHLNNVYAQKMTAGCLTGYPPKHPVRFLSLQCFLLCLIHCCSTSFRAGDRSQMRLAFISITAYLLLRAYLLVT